MNWFLPFVRLVTQRFISAKQNRISLGLRLSAFLITRQRAFTNWCCLRIKEFSWRSLMGRAFYWISLTNPYKISSFIFQSFADIANHMTQQGNDVVIAADARDAMPDGGKLTIENANFDLDQRRCGKSWCFARVICVDSGHRYRCRHSRR